MAVPGCGVSGVCDDIETEAPVSLGHVAQMNRLGIREPNDRGGVKACSDRKTLGKMLVAGLSGEEGGPVVRRRSRGIAAVPDKIALRLCGIRAFVVALGGGKNLRPFAIE